LFRSAATGLDLNFAGGVFSLNNTRTASPAAIPGWSFSRTDTNGTATALDLAGNVIQFATGVPRITNRGILVEEARTNLLLNSATLSTQTVTTTAVAHTLSFYGTGTVTLTGASTAGPLVGTGANNRVTLTFTPLAAPLILTVTGSVTTAQLEVGAFATSPIITTGAAGTRNGDQPAAGTSVLPPEGTIVLTYTVPPTAAGAAERLYGWRTEDSGNSRLALRIGDAGNNTAPAMVIGDGAAVSTLTGSNLTPGTTAKVACSYSTLSAQAALCVNGTDQTVARQTASSMLSTLFQIGQSSGDFSASSPLLRLQIIPRFLTAAERIALTAP
jgi:hypothetical protein